MTWPSDWPDVSPASERMSGEGWAPGHGGEPPWQLAAPTTRCNREPTALTERISTSTSFSKTSLKQFYTATDVKEKSNVGHVVGPFVNAPDVESTLDIQYLTAMGEDASNVPTLGSKRGS